MNILIFLLVLAATAIVMLRCIELAAHLNRKLWFGHGYTFGGFSISIALTAGGAVGVLVGWPDAPILLLLGIAGWMTFNRRF
ncbi:hypothetical protein GALL_71360 [mine drainage metagenome]|uniref:Uncharacterized protein n=1 Tax=mine drainage metagenome TaxID=410659 RepID=A0A1J5T3Y4_9ZZZZ